MRFFSMFSSSYSSFADNKNRQIHYDVYSVLLILDRVIKSTRDLFHKDLLHK